MMNLVYRPAAGADFRRNTLRLEEAGAFGWAVNEMLGCVFALVLVATLSFAQEPASSAPEAELPRLIEALDSDRFQERERASKRLRELGERALDELERATEHRSAEVRQRAKGLVRTITMQIDAEGFADLSRRGEDRIDLERGMWLIARIVNPRVRREELTQPLDELAERVRRRLGDVDPARADPQQAVAALRKVLFEEFELRGNDIDYANPENSSLDRVLATRKGLPITLSHVVVAVAGRLKIPIVGVPTPGRYIVKYAGAQAPPGFPRDDIYLDPYGGGVVLGPDELAQRFPQVDVAAIPPSTPRDSLVRMLANLERHCYDRGWREQAERANACRQLLAMK